MNGKQYFKHIEQLFFEQIKGLGYMENPPSYKTTPKGFFNNTLGVDYV